MKKTLILIVLFAALLTLSSCKDDPEPVDDGRFDNVIVFDHIDGYGLIDTRDAYILFEYRMRDYVKYQIAYVACTCRAAEVNFWKVAYVEIGTTNHELRKISYDFDGTGKYLAGFWGDSDPIPPYGNTELPLNEWITKADFDTHFIPWLLGKTLSDFDGISIFTNATYPGGHSNENQIEEQDLVDMFVGASVTSNNMIRIMIALLQYHNEKYSS
jgi:hypothetical protein